MPEEEKFECPDCGKVFGDEDTIREHLDVEHDGELNLEKPGKNFQMPDFSSYLNKSFALGLILGLIVSGAGFGGYMYWQSMDHRTEVPITVVTCDTCDYQKFRNATDKMFKAKYKEVDYQSEKGQNLIQKYNLKYVPGFILDRKVEEAEAFDRVKNTLVDSRDAYVIPDRGLRVAQRLSEGKELNRSQ